MAAWRKRAAESWPDAATPVAIPCLISYWDGMALRALQAE